MDLNPIRAGIAKTPEISRYTSAYDRIRGRQHKRGKKKAARNRQHARGATHADDWLSPLTLDERDAHPDGRPQRRASNKGFLSMTLEDYLRLLDWTGRQVRQDKSGHIPSDLAPILERLKIVPETWTPMVTQFGRWFGTAAGRAETLTAEAARRRRVWLQGVSASRTAFFA